MWVKKKANARYATRYKGKGMSVRQGKEEEHKDTTMGYWPSQKKPSSKSKEGEPGWLRRQRNKDNENRVRAVLQGHKKVGSEPYLATAVEVEDGGARVSEGVRPVPLGRERHVAARVAVGQRRRRHVHGLEEDVEKIQLGKGVYEGARWGSENESCKWTGRGR